MVVRLFRTVFAILVLLPMPALAQSSASAETGVVTLQPGDSIRIEIWREEDLSGGFLVNENGVATLPLLGEKRVTDIPVDRLREVLIEDYRELLRNPSIQIIPLRKVLVLGEVNNPGPYAVNPTESVLGVIALAGGATDAGNPRDIRIVRGGEIIMEQAPPGLALSDLGIRSGDQVVVQPRSWLARNRSFVVSVLLAVPSVIFTISRIDFN